MDAGFGKRNQVISCSANLFLTASTVLPLVNVAQTITSHRSLKNSFRLLSVRSSDDCYSQCQSSCRQCSGQRKYHDDLPNAGIIYSWHLGMWLTVFCKLVVLFCPFPNLAVPSQRKVLAYSRSLHNGGYLRVLPDCAREVALSSCGRARFPVDDNPVRVAWMRRPVASGGIVSLNDAPIKARMQIRSATRG
jgi:hypothetical protein